MGHDFSVVEGFGSVLLRRSNSPFFYEYNAIWWLYLFDEFLYVVPSDVLYCVVCLDKCYIGNGT